MSAREAVLASGPPDPAPVFELCLAFPSSYPFNTWFGYRLVYGALLLQRFRDKAGGVLQALHRRRRADRLRLPGLLRRPRRRAKPPPDTINLNPRNSLTTGVHLSQGVVSQMLSVRYTMNEVDHTPVLVSGGSLISRG